MAKAKKKLAAKKAANKSKLLGRHFLEPQYLD